MATVTVTLPDGLKIGDKTHTAATLRDYSAGDLIDACEAAEKVVPTDAGPLLVASPTKMDMELLCRQIVSIGEHKGPLSMAELRKLSGGDIACLQKAAACLDRGAAMAAQQRGRLAGGQGNA